jgi:hypothetical protein
MSPWPRGPRKVLLILAGLPMLCLNELHEADRICANSVKVDA